MYRVCVRQDFIAQHFLIGGDWGAENHPHSHHFILELVCAGLNLNQHGYLVDIAEIKEQMGATIDLFRDQLLNDLPDFSGLNPSVEHFCRILSEKICAKLNLEGAGIASLSVRLWEDDEAWASYEVAV
jgi:6-pyruvoyltetrahydropterin/6-carboxytetrahydropterin synthase